MPTTLTRTDVMNLALRELGSYRIASWDEDSTEAEIGRDVWDHVVRRALAAHGWRFATKQVQLQLSSETPVGRYAYAYTLPADMVRLGTVADNTYFDPLMTAYETIRLGNAHVLLTDYSTVYIEYVYEFADVGYWPPQFVDLVSAMLALAMVPSLKTSRMDMDKIVNQRLASARSIDSLQRPPRRPPLGSWPRAMRGYRK